MCEQFKSFGGILNSELFLLSTMPRCYSHGVDSLKVVGRFYFSVYFIVEVVCGQVNFQVLADTLNKKIVGVSLTNISASYVCFLFM